MDETRDLAIKLICLLTGKGVADIDLATYPDVQPMIQELLDKRNIDLKNLVRKYETLLDAANRYQAESEAKKIKLIERLNSISQVVKGDK